MNLLRFTVVAIALIAQAVHAEPPPTPPTAYRVVNVTNDSERGWVPSVALETRALATLQSYEAALNDGHADKAYALMGDGLKRLLPYTEFANQQTKFAGLAGARIGKRILAINWTKGSAIQPKPGIYAAIDVSYRYANIDRHCGFVILHAASEGSPFTVERTEMAYLDNATAAQITRDKSPGEVSRLWQQMTGYCSNYRPE